MTGDCVKHLKDKWNGNSPDTGRKGVENLDKNSHFNALPVLVRPCRWLIHSRGQYTTLTCKHLWLKGRRQPVVLHILRIDRGCSGFDL